MSLADMMKFLLIINFLFTIALTKFEGFNAHANIDKHER